MKILNIIGAIAFPAAFVCHFVLIKQGREWEPIPTFILSALAVLPLAALMGTATEHLSERAGPAWGGLLNATFGNAAEIIIGIIALLDGLNEVVKASLTGSILGNLLLVAGGAMVAGGLKYRTQTFNKNTAETNGGLLAIGVAAMLIPAIFHYTAEHARDPMIIQHQHALSIGASLVLMAIYLLGLLFTLKTHAYIFTPASGESPEEPPGLSAVHKPWSVKKSIIMLLLASAGVAVVAELLVHAADHMGRHLGWNPIFIGVILLAIVGNAAEHSTALLLARRNDMDTSMSITYQSSLQIALFATPLLVFLSAAFVALGWQKGVAMDLMFTPMEVVSVVVAVAVALTLERDGQTNWFEGAVLLALYVILGIAFFYIPAPAHGGVK